MIVTFEKKELEELYNVMITKKKPYNRYPKNLIKKFIDVVETLQEIKNIEELYLYNSLKYKKLQGDKKGIHSVRVNDKYRVQFRLEGGTIIIIEFSDYH
jgi:proteic killer suppression protein